MPGHNQNSSDRQLEMMTVTPEVAMSLLEHNKMNRPLRHSHVARIAGQIEAGKWKFNGDTIKIGTNGDVLDGQHRLWAVIEANAPIETILVRGINPDAFATMDAVRQVRSASDTVARLGHPTYRAQISTALAWLLRWQGGEIWNWRDPRNRVENSDIEEALAKHPGIVMAVERVVNLRRLFNPGVLAFLYYIMVDKNEAMAERLVDTLKEAAADADDPIWTFRQILAHSVKRKEPLVVIALAIKAVNAAHAGEKPKLIFWKSQGSNPEPFPKLKIDRSSGKAAEDVMIRGLPPKPVKMLGRA